MPVTDTQCRLQRFNNPCPFCTADPQAILHDFQARARTRVNARVALPFEEFENFLLREILRHVHRKRNDEPRIARLPGPRLHVGVNRVRIVTAHRPRAVAAMELCGAREQ